ncbi:MAG: putative RDD family membrane protein YckC [Verrucomicrobiales bacterium]|jgi:uncharacterized RDD family membrane protein YckC
MGMEGKLDTLQTNEIAEGVEIRLRVAGPALRGFALLLDVIFSSAALLIFAIALQALVLISPEIYQGLVMLFWFAVMWLYFTIFEGSKLGATPGKLIFGIRVVQTSGARMTWNQSIIRNVIRFIDQMPAVGMVLPLYFIGLVSCMCSRNFQRLGDLAAGTVVVYKEKPIDPVRLRMPLLNAQGVPELAPICPLTREEQEAIVKYTDRLQEWSENRQMELAGHAQPLTKSSGRPAVGRLLGIAKWIRSSG